MLSDEKIMKAVLRLAVRGRNRVHPNPMVGAILVKHGQVIEKAYHQIFGGPHAEINLLKKARDSARGGTVYVNLEPCCHHGKTGPCTQALIEAGVKEVIIGDLDPNPQVSGKGMELLKRNGIHTRCGVLRDECRKLNKAFYKYMTTGMPYVTVKIAQTLDGKISGGTAVRTLITGEAAQRETHSLRASHDAVLIGRGTAIMDNPLLTVRAVKGKNPLRLVLDSKLRLPSSLKLFKENSGVDTAIITTTISEGKKADLLKKKGVGIIRSKSDKSGNVAIAPLMKQLSGKMGISSLLVEGGMRVFTSFLKSGIVDTWIWYIAPKIFSSGTPGFYFPGDRDFRNTVFNIRLLKRLGSDIMIEAETAEEINNIPS